MKKLEYYISFGRDNNFNLIRFLAALAVIYSHCFPISQGAAALEPFESTLGISLGEIAVHVFFVTSGFLVTGSIIKKKELVGFFFARILRIFPALIVSGLSFFPIPFKTLSPLLSNSGTRAVLNSLKVKQV